MSQGKNPDRRRRIEIGDASHAKSFDHSVQSWILAPDTLRPAPDPLIGYHNVTEVVVGAQYPERDSNLDV